MREQPERYGPTPVGYGESGRDFVSRRVGTDRISMSRGTSDRSERVVSPPRRLTDRRSGSSGNHFAALSSTVDQWYGRAAVAFSCAGLIAASALIIIVQQIGSR